MIASSIKMRYGKYGRAKSATRRSAERVTFGFSSFSSE